MAEFIRSFLFEFLYIRVRINHHLIMPELPEVETTAKGLRERILKRAFVDVWSDWEKTVKKPQGFEDFKKELKHKKILNIWRRAKNVIFDLSGGMSLLVHQKMTGHLLVGKWKLEDGQWKPEEKGPLNDPYNFFIHLMFFLDDGKMMGLSDLRKFAKVELWDSKELKKELEKLGPEPLEKSFTFKKFKEVLKGKKGKIKVILMNPAVVSGIGNIYANEALWMSKIHPKQEVSKIKEADLKKLFDAIKKVLVLGVKLGGGSFSDYRKPDGSKGDFDTTRKVYQRERQPCFRCKTPIKRIQFAGRSSFVCEKCQKL